MKLIVLILTLISLGSLIVGCQSTDVDEEGWIEAGYIPPPDAPKVEGPSEEKALVTATPSPAPSKVEAPAKAVTPRTVSSTSGPKDFKAGLNVFSKDCRMKKDADESSEKVGFIKKGKKLWVDKHSKEWGKVYRKTGHAFVSASCL